MQDEKIENTFFSFLDTKTNIFIYIYIYNIICVYVDIVVYDSFSICMISYDNERSF